MSTTIAEDKPKEGFFSRSSLGRLFSGKKKEGKPELKHASMGATTTPSEQQHAAAMADISRKSALVKNSMSGGPRSTKSTDLMGDLADDFMRLKDETRPEGGAKAGAKKGEVWD